MILNILLLVFAYMIGSIPTALVMGRRLAGWMSRPTFFVPVSVSFSPWMISKTPISMAFFFIASA